MRRLKWPSLSQLWRLNAVLAIAHFLFFAATPQIKVQNPFWNTESCVLQTTGVHVDGENCRYFYTRAVGLSQPWLAASQSPPRCVLEQSAEGAELHQVQEALRAGPCKAPEPPVWPTTLSSGPDVGWDALSVWYVRGLAFYYQIDARHKAQQCGTWAGCAANVLGDHELIRSFANKEHFHYPNLVPFIFALQMKLWGGPDPLPLQIFQVLLLALSVFLFWKTRGNLSLSQFLAFALVPIAGTMVFRLYSDLWMIVLLLGVVASWGKHSKWIPSLLLLLVPFTKTEAWVQAGALVATLILIEGLSTQTLRRRSLPLLALIASTGIYLFLVQAPLKSTEFYVPLTTRLLEPVESLKILGRILGYYADVVFRPALWGLLWPLVMWSFWKERSRLGWTLAPLVLVFVAIPLAFLSFPFGHKEVVLTGSNRALWQTLPLVWVLLGHSLRARGSR